MSNRKLTDDLLKEVAAVYVAAPQRSRQDAVGDLLGVDARRASFYIYQARRRGFLAPPTGDMRVVKP